MPLVRQDRIREQGRQGALSPCPNHPQTLCHKEPEDMTMSEEEREREVQQINTLFQRLHDSKRIELTDSEVAVLIDSLVFVRDHLGEEGIVSPNITSALDKINSIMTPATFGLIIEAKS
jgi:hypothetical protein